MDIKFVRAILAMSWLLLAAALVGSHYVAYCAGHTSAFIEAREVK